MKLMKTSLYSRWLVHCVFSIHNWIVQPVFPDFLAAQHGCPNPQRSLGDKGFLSVAAATACRRIFWCNYVFALILLLQNVSLHSTSTLQAHLFPHKAFAHSTSQAQWWPMLLGAGTHTAFVPWCGTGLEIGSLWQSNTDGMGGERGCGGKGKPRSCREAVHFAHDIVSVHCNKPPPPRARKHLVTCAFFSLRYVM